MKKLPIISDQIEEDELSLILSQLEEVLKLNLSGDVCEFGCYRGTTSIFLQQIITKYSPQKRLFLYDSFEGLPNKSGGDFSAAGEEFQPGELKASKVELIRTFKKYGLRVPIIKKAWFKDLGAEDIPLEACFAFLDGDFYESIAAPLNLIASRVASGGIVIVDDYGNPKLPGAKLAVDEFLKLNLEFKLIREQASLAILQRL